MSPYFGNTHGLRCYRTHRIQCFLQALHNIMTALDWPNRMIGPNDFIYVICHRLHTQFSFLIISASSWIRETLLKAQIRSMGEVAPRWIMALEPLSGPHARLDIWWPIVKCTCCTREFSLKSRLLWASFHPLSPLWVRKFY